MEQNEMDLNGREKLLNPTKLRLATFDSNGVYGTHDR